MGKAFGADYFVCLLFIVCSPTIYLFQHEDATDSVVEQRSYLGMYFGLTVIHKVLFNEFNVWVVF